MIRLLKVLTMLRTVFLCHCGVDAFRHEEITAHLGTFDTINNDAEELTDG